jgi:tetratricopeptide (TPR) repeat protein
MSQMRGEAFFYRASAHEAMGDYLKAVVDYEKAASAIRGSSMVYNNLGVAYSKAGMHGEALKAMGEALRLAPDNPDIFYNRGLIYAAMEEDAKAAEDYRRAARLGHAKAGAILASKGLAW